MKIDIKQFKEKKKLFIFVDNCVIKALDLHLFKSVDFPTSCPSLDEFNRWFDKVENKIAKKYVLKLLAKKNYLKKDLEKKLMEKHFSTSTIKTLTEHVVKKGYVNDDKWVRFYIEKLYNKGYGPYYIARSLDRKRVSSTIYKKLLDTLINAKKQKQKLAFLIKNKFNKEPKDKLIAKLRRRGYDVAIIYDVIKTLPYQQCEETQSPHEYSPCL